ncbi:MAG: hypothetical protein RIR51_451 [Bacteroidota bacterium]|jgi:pimeloyl-ACP methyl ester carboxylesterase
MKKLFLFLLINFPLFSQIERIDLGKMQGGSYQILMPTNWNKTLVMYAHGYSFMGTPVENSNRDLDKRLSYLLQEGYAVAASDYISSGMVYSEGIEATEELRAAFVEKFHPEKSYIMGHSMGGGITMATIEFYGKNYEGALALCPFGSNPSIQIRKEFDIYATFNGLYPGIAPSLKTLFDLNNDFKLPSFADIPNFMKNMNEKLANIPQEELEIFAKNFDLKVQDIGMSLFFNQNVLRDIAIRFQGNPFDNTQTVYTGFRDDVKVNLQAERMAATVSPNKYTFTNYDRKGNINKPLLAMHTLYDQLIPAKFAISNYERGINQNGKNDLFRVKYTNGSRHCDFRPDQELKVFHLLKDWAEKGEVPNGGMIE